MQSEDHERERFVNDWYFFLRQSKGDYDCNSWLGHSFWSPQPRDYLLEVGLAGWPGSLPHHRPDFFGQGLADAGWGNKVTKRYHQNSWWLFFCFVSAGRETLQVSKYLSYCDLR